MRRIDFYRLKKGENLGDAETLDKRFEDVDLRLAATEDALEDVDAVADRVESVALDRINNVLTPLTTEALERLSSITTIFEASTSTEMTIGEGSRLMVVDEGKRLTFAPLSYLVVFPTGDLSRYMMGRLISYSQDNGQLAIDVLRAVGSGTETEWQIAPVAFVSELESLADAAANAANLTEADRIAIAADKVAIEAFKNAAQTAATNAVTAKTGAESALATFMQVFRGALNADPSGGSQGHFYFNTAQQVAKVYTSSGWAPLFSLTLGGIRQGDITATAGQTVFNVGAFAFMNVFLNGTKLLVVEDYTAVSPNITLTAAASAGDVFSYLGYFDTEITDVYSKAASNVRFVNQLARADIAGAATTSIGSVEASSVNVTGTATIGSFGVASAGVRKSVRFAGASTLTHSAALALIGSADITTAAGDFGEFESLGGGNWRATSFSRASGRALVQGLAPTLANDLRVDVTSNSAVTVQAAALMLRDDASARMVVDLNLSADLGDIANRIDAGAEQSSVWYAVYVIAKANGADPVVRFLLGGRSAFTMPAGYKLAAYVGSVRNDGSGHLLRTIQRDNVVQISVGVRPATYVPLFTGALAADSAILLDSMVPPTARGVEIALSNDDTTENSPIAVSPVPGFNGETSATNSPYLGVRDRQTVIKGTLYFVEPRKLYAYTTTRARGAVMGWVDGL